MDWRSRLIQRTLTFHSNKVLIKRLYFYLKLKKKNINQIIMLVHIKGLITKGNFMLNVYILH